jgi:c-di-GMP-binding flagellar brake protein YcgR
MTAANPAASTSESSSNVAAQASAIEMLSDDQYSKYMLQSKNEMLPVFRGLIDSVSQVTMFFNEGRDMVLTSLVSCGDAGIVLDYGPSNDLNRKALDADKLFCVTQLDKVKIQFVLRGLGKTDDNGRPAFKAAWPDSMMRLQRREFFRLTLPLTRPLKCTLTVAAPGGSKLPLECQVADLSGGGMGLVGLRVDAPLEPEMELPLTRLELPEVGIISGKLKICSVTEVTNRMGLKSKRAGCEFVTLPGPMQTLIQRYIIKIERERKARETGMS